MTNVYANKSIAMKNTQRINISKSSQDIQVQYDMHLQEALMFVARDENFIS
jgi:hypothetical protein